VTKHGVENTKNRSSSILPPVFLKILFSSIFISFVIGINRDKRAAAAANAVLNFLVGFFVFNFLFSTSIFTALVTNNSLAQFFFLTAKKI
jgi:hypothetical protein